MMPKCGGMLVATLTLFVSTPTAVHAQDEAGALAAVERIFEGMRTANSEMVTEVFAIDARFAVLSARDGPAAVAVQSVDGGMASIWAPYTFYLDGAIRHCGVNSIELLYEAEGWKVTQLSDTRRTENCPDPLGR